MTGQDLYRIQVTLVLGSLATILACSVYSLYFAQSSTHHFIDLVLIAISTLVIVYADDFAVKLHEYVTRTQSSEQTPPAMK